MIALIGLGVALARRDLADRVLATFVAVYFVALLPLDSHFDRYVLPLVPVLGVLAGRFRSFAPVTLLLLVVPFAWTVRDTRELTRSDAGRCAGRAPSSGYRPGGESRARARVPALRGVRLGRGAARRRDRVEPRARAVLRQLALRLGRPDRRRADRASRSATGSGASLADRMPSTGLLLATMSLGALLVLAIPYVDDRVLQFVVDWDPGARLNPLVAASILFGPMSVVLAAVTPIAVRIAALDVATLGRTAGRLFAVSTVGSIVGTFATAFVLIPELGTNQLLALGAAVLLAGTALVAVARALPIVGRRRARRGRGRRSALVVARAGAGRHAHRCRRGELLAGLPPPRGERRRAARTTRPRAIACATARTARTTRSPSSRTSRTATSASTAPSRARWTSTTRS